MVITPPKCKLSHRLIHTTTQAALNLKNLKIKRDCSYVLPSSEILGGYKQMEASQAELKLACTFYGKKVQTEVNYFDPTTKISIGGEWQSLILVHSDGQ